MDKMLLEIFHREVERQSRFGLIASADLDAALECGDMDRIWYSVQSLLGAAGNASKLLWPPQPQTPKHPQPQIPKRGEDLRESLGVPDSSPLEPRAFRNHFEHFDERLEQWATSSQRRNFTDSNVGTTGMISGLDPGDYLRNFDTKEYAVTFRGDKYPLKPIIEALQDLHNKTQSASGGIRQSRSDPASNILDLRGDGTMENPEMSEDKGKKPGVNKQLPGDLISHLSKEIELMSNNTTTSRLRAALLVWIGPFILLGVFVSRGLTTNDTLDLKWWLIVPAFFVGSVMYGLISMMSGRIENYAWTKCNEWRELIATAATGGEMDPTVVQEKIKDDVIVQSINRWYTVIWGAMFVSFIVVVVIAYCIV